MHAHYARLCCSEHETHIACSQAAARILACCSTGADACSSKRWNRKFIDLLRNSLKRVITLRLGLYRVAITINPLRYPGDAAAAGSPQLSSVCPCSRASISQLRYRTLGRHYTSSIMATCDELNMLMHQHHDVPSRHRVGQSDRYIRTPNAEAAGKCDASTSRYGQARGPACHSNVCDAS